jgi:ABC-type oligopeptide transport system ATPase subunit
MHHGKIVEQGSPDKVTQSPESPITKQLLEDIPSVNHDWIQRDAPKVAAG